MKRITAWILTLACFLGCRMAMPAYAEADVPALEPGSVVEDVVLKEVFTFTDKAGNVSEPQVRCSWDWGICA